MDGGLSLGRGFFKGHGHGNDYLVFREGRDWPVRPDTVRAVCDRWRGVGGDGIVALLGAPYLGAAEGGGGGAAPAPPFRLRMFNPDGSEFERSGNGLRVLGSHLLRMGWVNPGEPFPVEVGGDRVEMEILGQGPGGEVDVAVEMGRTRFGLGAVGGREEAGGQGILGPSGEALELQPVSVGNPHCVVFRNDLREADLLVLGPHLTRHPAFPAGTNVQLARVSGTGEVHILIWERGVGRTSSSGTSACAVAAACVRTGRLAPGPVRVVMEGGAFQVTVSERMEVRLQGPVQPVMEGEIAAELLATFAP